MSLKPAQWVDFIKILQEFDHDISELRDSHNEDYVWQLVINIKENIQDELREAMRVNLRLCFFLEEEKQLKELNSPLFKLNHVLDQNFYRLDNESNPGLKNFHKILISTYGSVDKFIEEYKKVKENLYFVRKRFDEEIIEQYSYLKNISLPLKGYENIRLALFTLLNKFSRLSLIVHNPDHYLQLVKEVEEFKNKYIERYIEEHETFQNELDYFYENLHSLPEYEALSHLSEIKVIKVAYNIKPIKKYVDTFFPEKCQVEHLKDLLKKQPKCNCGFHLGDVLTVPALSKIKPMLRKGIKEYIHQLHNPKFIELFEEYFEKKEDSRLKKIFKIERDNLEEFIELIDENIIAEINRVLNNTFPLKVSLDELASTIIGSYPANQLNLLTKEVEKAINEVIEHKVMHIDGINFDNIVIRLTK